MGGLWGFRHCNGHRFAVAGEPAAKRALIRRIAKRSPLILGRLGISVGSNQRRTVEYALPSKSGPANVKNLADLFERETVLDGGDEFFFRKVRHFANTTAEQNRLWREDGDGASDCIGLVTYEVGDVLRECGVCLLELRIKQSKMIGVAHEDTPEERRREQPIHLASRGTLLGTRRRHERYLLKAE